MEELTEKIHVAKHSQSQVLLLGFKSEYYTNMAHPHMQKVKKNDEPTAYECVYISSFHDFFL
jgi:hypothetical protein